LLGFVVDAESGLSGGVETIDLRDSGGGGLSRMFDAGEEEVFGRGDGWWARWPWTRLPPEWGRDGCGVAVELGLRHADGGRRWVGPVVAEARGVMMGVGEEAVMEEAGGERWRLTWRRGKSWG
jgi:hypothetical protein